MRYFEIIGEQSPPAPKAGIWQTQEFKLWFGKSKIVNADGSPKICTNTNDIVRIIKTTKPFGRGGCGYFVDSTNDKSISFFLKIENPVIINCFDRLAPWIERDGDNTPEAFIARILKDGYDGIITNDSIDPSSKIKSLSVDWRTWQHPLYIAFRPNQVKSNVSQGKLDNDHILDIQA